MSTILVTGAAGFIASKTADLLLQQGNKVIGIDNLNDYYDVKLKHYRLDKLKQHQKFSFYHIDIEQHNDLEKIFLQYKFDAVINLAARAGVRYSIQNPYVYVNTNEIGTLNLLELMRKNNVKKMVIASSSSLYAGQNMPFTENLPVNTPISPYAASKKAAEMMCYTYHYLYGLDITILRYFTVYGPAGRPDMSIFRFCKWIDEGVPITLNGDGTQSRDFTYVDDIAKGTILALKDVKYDVINLGGGQKPYSLNYVIQKIEELLGKKAVVINKPFHKADVDSTWADITKAKRILNWEPTIDIDEGLKRAVEWQKENRKLTQEIRCTDD